MEITILDFILINILSFLFGVATGLTVCCKFKDKFMQRSRSIEDLSKLNHQRLLYPTEAPIIPATVARGVTEIKLTQ